LGGLIMGHVGWGRSVYGPYSSLCCSGLRVDVSRCGPAAVVRRGCQVFRRGKLIILLGFTLVCSLYMNRLWIAN